MSLTGIEDNYTQPLATRRTSRLFAQMLWLVLSLAFIYIMADIVFKPALSSLLRGDVTKAQLVAAAKQEFQVQYDAINTGMPTRPFPTAADATDWAEHSKLVVFLSTELTDQIKSGQISPAVPFIDHVGWVPAWNTPVLKMRVSSFDETTRKGSWDSLAYATAEEVIVSFHEVDGRWRVASVDSAQRWVYHDSGFMQDRCNRLVNGKWDRSLCAMPGDDI